MARVQELECCVTPDTPHTDLVAEAPSDVRLPGRLDSFPAISVLTHFHWLRSLHGADGSSTTKLGARCGDLGRGHLARSTRASDTDMSGLIWDYLLFKTACDTPYATYHMGRSEPVITRSLVSSPGAP